MTAFLQEHGFEVVGTILPDECCHMLLVKRDIKALRDSGNDLHDPVSGLPAAVVERAAVLPLFPALHALPDDAVQALEALSALPECTGRVVLLPYRAVGVTGALLPAFRPDSVKIDGAAEPMLLALSAQALTSDGAFAMVLPPKS